MQRRFEVPFTTKYHFLPVVTELNQNSSSVNHVNVLDSIDRNVNNIKIVQSEIRCLYCYD